MAISDSDGAGCKDVKDCKKEYLHRKASAIVKALSQQDLEARNDLEAMADIVDTGAYLYDSYDELLPALSEVFLGVEESNKLTALNAHNLPESEVCSIIGRFCKDDPEKGYFLDSGFNKKYRDKENQPYHFWAYLATSANTEGSSSYIPGMLFGTGGNIVHELDPKSQSRSWQDFALGQEAVAIGMLINFGVVQPDQLGNYLREHLGP